MIKDILTMPGTPKVSALSAFLGALSGSSFKPFPP